MNWDDERAERDRQLKKKIYENVGKGLNFVGIIMWIGVGILLGVVISTFIIKEVTEIHPAQHTFIDSVATGDGYVTLEFNNTDRDFFYTTSVGTSMYPSMWTDSFQIYMYLQSTDELEIGDVIAYTISGTNKGIVHRIVDISEDEQGFYVITKGDNNLFKDDWRIRDFEIQGVLIGVTY